MAIRIKPIGKVYEPKAVEKVVREYIERGLEEIAQALAEDVTKRVQPDWLRNRVRLLMKRAVVLEQGFQRFMAERIAEHLKNGIFRQKWKSRWKRLSPKYLKWKKRKGLDTRILLAHHYYISSITVYRSGGDWVVGVKPFQKHPATGVRMEKLARFLEFGTSRMPPRPHWRPALEEVRRNSGRFLRRYLRDVKAFR